MCYQALGNLAAGDTLWVHKGRVTCAKCYVKTKGKDPSLFQFLISLFDYLFISVHTVVLILDSVCTVLFTIIVFFLLFRSVVSLKT